MVLNSFTTSVGLSVCWFIFLSSSVCMAAQFPPSHKEIVFYIPNTSFLSVCMLTFSKLCLPPTPNQKKLLSSVLLFSCTCAKWKKLFSMMFTFFNLIQDKGFWQIKFFLMIFTLYAVFISRCVCDGNPLNRRTRTWLINRLRVLPWKLRTVTFFI